MAAAVAAAVDSGLFPAGRGVVFWLIGRLLGGREISDNLRQELTDMKRAIAEGEFDTMDSRYIRALAKRLGA